MQSHTAADLIEALRASGLFSPEQFLGLLRELDPLGDDPQALMRHIVNTKQLTVYQLRKVVHGKAAELFIGDYLITDKIGEGGMGKVYRARQVRTDREVALKVVRSNLLSNPVVRGRYDREVKAAGALQHTNIVAVEDAGEVDGRWYLAMEFVDGIDLARLVRTHGVLPVPEACEYLRQAALGLQYAHDLGFIHRDMKPSNIIVSGERHVPEAEGPAHVKILDMGLVRGGGFDEDDADADLTRAGTVVGTPDYMAPEQAKNSSTVDHRADLYGLGCTFYFLLTGKPPFPDGSPIEKLLKHQVDPPQPLQALRPDVPNELAQIVARLMAKEPAERFASARELAEALEPLTGYSGGAAPVVARAGGVAAYAAETVPGSPPCTPEQATATVPGVSSGDPTPRPTYSLREPRRPTAEPSPFEFPLGPPSEPAPSIGPHSRWLTPSTKEPPQKLRTPVVVAVVIIVLLVFVVATWGLVRLLQARPHSGTLPPAGTSADHDPKAPFNNTPRSKPGSPGR